MVRFDRVLAPAIEVHRHLGPGLLESSYIPCVHRELADRGLTFQAQQPVPLTYKGETFYVCCSGCRDAFNENPEKYVKEFKAKKAGK